MVAVHKDYGARIQLWSMILLCLLVALGLAFLIIGFFAREEFIAKRTYRVEGQSGQVNPAGSGDPDGYMEGAMTFHITQRTINWELFYGAVGSGLSLEIIGPLDPGTSPLTGPPFLALCGGTSAIACLVSVPNTLTQKIIQTSPGGQFLDPFINVITANAHHYRLLLRSQDFPNGALVSRINALI